MTIYYCSYWSFNGNLRVEIQWILIILTLRKASKLENNFVYMATLLQFILEFQRKFKGIDTVDIDNIDVQKGPQN
jgi:hypothetical protein